MPSRCYLTRADKAAKFPAVVIPALFAQAQAESDDPTLLWWLRAGTVLDYDPGPRQLEVLHDLARAGRYSPPAAWHCDPHRAVADTVLYGGDCDQWAAVVMAALCRIGYSYGLYTFGQPFGDEFQHVAPAAEFGLRWYLLDAKGDQAGNPFDTADPNYQARKLWRA